MVHGEVVVAEPGEYSVEVTVELMRLDVGSLAEVDDSTEVSELDIGLELSSLLELNDSEDVASELEVGVDVTWLVVVNEDEQLPTVPELIQTQTALVVFKTASSSEDRQAPITQSVASFVMSCLFVVVHWQA